MRGPDLTVEQRRCEELLQIVVALLLGPRMVLRAIVSTSGEVEARLEDVAAHTLNLCRNQPVAALPVQYRFQRRSTMNERAVHRVPMIHLQLSGGCSATPATSNARASGKLMSINVGANTRCPADTLPRCDRMTVPRCLCCLSDR
jgi:hypothetical protein